MGVEEEFLLVDPEGGEPIARNKQVAACAAEHGVQLQLELTSCQVETTTDVMDTSTALRAELNRLRRVATEAAAANGAQLLAAALPPTVSHKFPVTPTPRYRKIAHRFGMIAHRAFVVVMCTSRYLTGKPRFTSATGCDPGCTCCWR